MVICLLGTNKKGVQKDYGLKTINKSLDLTFAIGPPRNSRSKTKIGTLIDGTKKEKSATTKPKADTVGKDLYWTL